MDLLTEQDGAELSQMRIKVDKGEGGCDTRHFLQKFFMDGP